MNLMKTEWKKIWYGKTIVHMLLICLSVSLFCMLLMSMAKSNSRFFCIMQAYYEAGQKEPGIMSADTYLSPENSIGYILGLNDWSKPEEFEIYRSAMFPTFIFMLIFLITISSLYAKEYSLLMFRQAIFCGAGKFRVFISKFVVNFIFCGMLYLANIAGLYVIFSIYAGYIPSGKEVTMLLTAILLNILNFAVFESMAVLLVGHTKNSIVGIVVNILWFFSSFMIYPMVHKDFWGYGKIIGVIAALSPGTYLYKICSGLVTKEVILNNSVYVTFMLLLLWTGIMLKLRKQEV